MNCLLSKKRNTSFLLSLCSFDFPLSFSVAFVRFLSLSVSVCVCFPFSSCFFLCHHHGTRSLENDPVGVHAVPSWCTTPAHDPCSWSASFSFPLSLLLLLLYLFIFRIHRDQEERRWKRNRTKRIAFRHPPPPQKKKKEYLWRNVFLCLSQECQPLVRVLIPLRWQVNWKNWEIDEERCLWWKKQMSTLFRGLVIQSLLLSSLLYRFPFDWLISIFWSLFQRPFTLQCALLQLLCVRRLIQVFFFSFSSLLETYLIDDILAWFLFFYSFFRFGGLCPVWFTQSVFAIYQRGCLVLYSSFFVLLFSSRFPGDIIFASGSSMHAAPLPRFFWLIFINSFWPPSILLLDLDLDWWFNLLLILFFFFDYSLQRLAETERRKSVTKIVSLEPQRAGGGVCLIFSFLLLFLSSSV